MVDHTAESQSDCKDDQWFLNRCNEAEETHTHHAIRDKQGYKDMFKST